MVETTGVEPVVPCGRRIYSPLGLPIFLHLHLTNYTLYQLCCQHLVYLSSAVVECNKICNTLSAMRFDTVRR